MSFFATLTALVLVTGLDAPAPRAQEEQSERPAAVAALLAERCGSCHSPGSDEPKAQKHWALALDLAGTVHDADLVVPGKPDDSDLYLAIDFDDMPPEGSDGAPLSAAEKALVEDWIRAGAEAPVPEESAARAASVERPSGWMQSTLARWASHFHPMLVHFPVALLVAALLAELLARVSKSRGLRTAATFCLALGALAALPSATLGWLLAANTSHPASDVFYHRWLGISTALASLLVLWGGHRWPRKRLLMLLLIAALVGATGHTGGSLVYGSSWLDWPS